ncbi:MAG: Gar1/Naf1 family protein [Candidatus Bathyarchaeia archaeon]
MKKIGQILHAGLGNRAIVKVESLPNLGATVFDIKKRPIGVVLDIFGPVKSPYVEIEVKDQNPKKMVGSPIYILPKTKNFKGKRGK